MSVAFGEALRRERSRRGEKQREAAARFDVSQPSYHRWEAGTSMPDDKLRNRLADYLGVSVGELWELIHFDAVPVSLGQVQSDVATLQDEVSNLKKQLRKLEDRVAEMAGK